MAEKIPQLLVSGTKSPTSPSRSLSPGVVRRAEKGVGEVIVAILSNLGIPTADVSRFVKILEDNLITTEAHLLRIPPADLPRLQLPLLLEVELRRYILLALREPQTARFQSPNRLGGLEGSNRSSLDALEIPNGAPRKHSYDSDLLEMVEVRERSFSSSSSGSDVTSEPAKQGKKPEALTAESLTDMLLPRSILFNVTKKEREAIREQWRGVQNSADALAVFYSVFYEELFKIDARSKHVWEKEPVEERNTDLLQYTTMIVGAVCDPTNHLPAIHNSAVRHLIWEYDSKHFQSWAVAFTKALETALPPDSVSAEMKEVWLSVITRVGDLIIGCYDKLRTGLQGVWLRKSASGWKPHYMTLTHNSLIMSSDFETRRTKEELPLRDFKEVVRIEGNDERIAPKPTSFCFALRSNEYERYFAVETEPTLNVWLQELRLRVAAWNHKGRVDGVRHSESASKFRPKSRRAAQRKSVAPQSANDSADTSPKKTTALFDDISSDRLLLADFKKHLETRMNAEYLQFWQDVRKWKSSLAKATDEEKGLLKAKADAIYHKYVAEDQEDTSFTLYLSPRSVQLVAKQMQHEKLEPSLFDTAFQEAEHAVLRPQFSEYLKAKQ